MAPTRLRRLHRRGRRAVDAQRAGRDVDVVEAVGLARGGEGRVQGHAGGADVGPAGVLQGCAEDAEDAVVFDEFERLDLGVADFVVVGAADHEVATVHATEAVLVVEVGLHAAGEALEQAVAERVRRAGAEHGEVDRFVGHAGHAFDRFERADVRLGRRPVRCPRSCRPWCRPSFRRSCRRSCRRWSRRASCRPLRFPPARPSLRESSSLELPHAAKTRQLAATPASTRRVRARC